MYYHKKCILIQSNKPKHCMCYKKVAYLWQTTDISSITKEQSFMLIHSFILVVTQNSRCSKNSLSQYADETGKVKIQLKLIKTRHTTDQLTLTDWLMLIDVVTNFRSLVNMYNRNNRTHWPIIWNKNKH